jgi:Tol biopolymer transport system component
VDAIPTVRTALLLATGAVIAAPAPSTLHGRIVFEAIRTVRSAGLVVMAADGSHRAPISGTRRHTRFVVTHGAYAYTGRNDHLFVVDAAGTHDIGLGAPSGFSPDGSTIVVAKGDGSWVLRDADTGVVRGTFPATLSFHGWSPSGLLFSEDDNLVVVQADGSGERTVARDASLGNALFSPDGAWIAYRTAANELRVVRPDGSDDHAIGRVGPDNDLVWSPDGTRIAYAGPSGYLVFATTAGTTVTTGVYPLSPFGSWSPDGSSFACQDDTGRARPPLLVVSAVTGAARVVSRVGGRATWSPDGSKLLVELGNGFGVIAAAATVKQPTLFVHNAVSETWLSDGRLIAYLNEETDEQAAEVAATGGPVRYIAGTRGEFQPVPSPDGTKLAFASVSDRTKLFTISVASADGSHRRVIAQSRAILPSPSWSPDGRFIAYASADAVDVIPSTGGRPRRVTGAELPWTVAWSPDGTEIAFGNTPGDSDFADIVLVHPDGTHRRVVVHRGAGVNWGGIAWSPDGGSLAVARRSDSGGDPDGNPDLYLVDVRTHREREIGLDLSDASFSPDGRRLAVAKDDGTIEVLGLGSTTGLGTIAHGSHPAWSR